MFSVFWLSVALVGGDPLPESAREELKLLQGKWLVQRLETKDQTYQPREGDGELVLEIKGHKWIFTGQEKGEIVAIDPKTDPRCMDLKSVEKGRAGQVEEAIYKVEGDTLTICVYQGKGKQRPTSFESPKQADTILAVFKRMRKE
jgi:uncharacterized protein (TIGR03067 family)